MSLARNIALSKLDPSTSRTERMMRDQQRMAQMNQNWEKETQRNDQLRSEMHQRALEQEQRLKEFSIHDSRKIRESLKIERDKIYDLYKKVNGNSDMFFRKGGAELIRNYENSILTNDNIAKARHNAKENARFHEYQKAGIPISRNSRLAREAWNKGVIDTFDVTPLEKIDLLKLAEGYYTYEAVGADATYRSKCKCW